MTTTDTGRTLTASELQPCKSSQRASTYDVAQALIDAVHHGDHLATQRILRRPDLPRIAAELALRLPAAPRPLLPCGTRSAAERHIVRGELLDDDCAAARRAYYAQRRRAQRARAREQTQPPRRGRRPLSLSEHVDPVVVDRLLTDGSCTAARTSEQYAAYVQLRRRGVTATAACERLGLSSSARTLFADTYSAQRDLEETG